MKLFGSDIKRNRSVAANPLSLLLLGLAVFWLWEGMHNTAYMASYRFGETIIPKKSQLSETGPYIMGIVKQRIGSNIRFQPIGAGTPYQERDYDFDVRSEPIETLAREMNGKASTYLWVFPNNPMRQVWRIDINGHTILTYQRALADYRRDESNNYRLFILSAISFFIFAISMFRMERVKAEL